jgi:hypothetical protein
VTLFHLSVNGTHFRTRYDPRNGHTLRFLMGTAGQLTPLRSTKRTEVSNSGAIYAVRYTMWVRLWILNECSIVTAASEFHRARRVIPTRRIPRARSWLGASCRVSFVFLPGLWSLLIGLGIYFGAILLSIVRLVLFQPNLFVHTITRLLWISGLPTTIGILLITVDLAAYLPRKRRGIHCVLLPLHSQPLITVALTAYNDELSIAAAVRDFLGHRMVKRVIVVSNNSKDCTMERAIEAGAITVNEERQGYGHCVYRCLAEAAQWVDTDLIALCEGDMTFRAADLDKFVAYISHAEIVNGTRIVEQLREYDTQLSTFMYYGNFFAGKLLEAKHLGKGTFTDVGTTYKVMRRDTVPDILRFVQPTVNLEFNAHFLDTALRRGFTVVECPVTFHSRIGESKGGNVNNRRAFKVGLRMIWGLTFGWGRLA